MIHIFSEDKICISSDFSIKDIDTQKTDFFLSKSINFITFIFDLAPFPEECSTLCKDYPVSWNCCDSFDIRSYECTIFEYDDITVFWEFRTTLVIIHEGLHY